MANNLPWTPGSGANISTKERGDGSHCQVVHVDITNAAGSPTNLVAGQTTMSASVPVAIASDQTKLPTTIVDSVGDSCMDDANNAVRVNIIAGAGSGGTAMADDAAFTPGTTNFTPAGGTYRSVRDLVDDNDGGAFAMTQRRAILGCLETPNGDSAMDDTNDSVKVTLAGTNAVTANAGTNLNTSALALESGGNLAAAATSLAIIDDWDETDRAKVNPIVGQAGVAAGAGAVGATVQRMTLASDDPAVASLSVLDDWDSSDACKVVGPAAHDAAISGNPVIIGGVSSAAAPTSVTADQEAVRAWYLRNGAQATVLTAAGALIGGDATNGLDVDVTRVPTDPFGVNADAASATGSISAKLRSIATAIEIMDDWDESDRAKVNIIAGQAGISAGVGASGAAVPRIVIANDFGKTLLSAGGSASSSGNNTLVAAGTNKLKVYGFSLSTLSTTAITCIFQSGAGGTELWRVVLQAPTSVSTGANLIVVPPAFIFATASATLLNLNLSSANAVHWSVCYFDEA